MLTITSAQIAAWLAAFGWPFARILAVVATEPIFGNRAIPAMVKVAFAAFLTMAAAPAFEAAPKVDPGSWAGLFILMQEIVVGIAIGFSMRLFYSATEMAGSFIGLQMGLGFALFFDPQNSGQTPIVAQFVGILTILVFVSMGGHEMVILSLMESFSALPVGADPVSGAGFRQVAELGGMIFRAGMWLALPVVGSILVVNLSLGIMTRAAPQLNIFAVGFPITLGLGFVVLLFALPYMTPLLERLLYEGTRQMVQVAATLRP